MPQKKQQIQQIIVPIVVLAVGISGYFGFSAMKKPPEEKEIVDETPIVAVQTVNVAPMTLHVNSYGIVKPKYETALVAQVSGQIVELSETFVRGGFVTKGQLLARIDPSDYEAALIEAKSNMASAQASLKTEIAQGKIAKRERNNSKSSTATELGLRKPQLAQEKARLESAKASVLRAERNLERTQITAPYDALIDSRNIGLGSFVSIGSNIGKLLGTALAEVRLPVADNQLQYLVANGEHALVNLKGTYAGKNIQWQAKIARNEGVIDNTSRMSYLVAEINDPYALTPSDATPSPKSPLRFGSYVNAEILGVQISNATSIPSHLVEDDRIAILNHDSTLQYVDVDIYRQDGSNVIISNGLTDGDQLIISALDYPVDGMKVALPAKKLNDNENTTEHYAKTRVTNVENN